MAENKNKKSNKIDHYLPFNKVLIRTPFLPFETLDNINLDKLKEITKRDVFQEAIFLASPIYNSICTIKSSLCDIEHILK